MSGRNEPFIFHLAFTRGLNRKRMYRISRFVESSTLDENYKTSDPIAGYADFSNDAVTGFIGMH